MLTTEVLKHDFSIGHWKRTLRISPEEVGMLRSLAKKVGSSVLGFEDCTVDVSTVESRLIDFCQETELHNMLAHRTGDDLYKVGCILVPPGKDVFKEIDITSEKSSTLPGPEFSVGLNPDALDVLYDAQRNRPDWRLYAWRCPVNDTPSSDTPSLWLHPVSCQKHMICVEKF